MGVAAKSHQKEAYIKEKEEFLTIFANNLPQKLDSKYEKVSQNILQCFIKEGVF